MTDALGFLADMQDAIADLSELFADFVNDPLLIFDANWKFDVALQLAIMQVTYDQTAARTPPSSMRDIHMNLVDAFRKMSEATGPIARGIDNIDPDSINQGTILLSAANDDLSEGPRLISEFQRTRSGSC